MIVHDSEYIDFSKVPQSQGMSKSTIVIVLVGLLGIFIMGGLSIGFASWGHVWPSEKSQRIDLGTMSH